MDNLVPELGVGGATLLGVLTVVLHHLRVRSPGTTETKSSLPPSNKVLDSQIADIKDDLKEMKSCQKDMDKRMRNIEIHVTKIYARTEITPPKGMPPT